MCDTRCAVVASPVFLSGEGTVLSSNPERVRYELVRCFDLIGDSTTPKYPARGADVYIVLHNDNSPDLDEVIQTLCNQLAECAACRPGVPVVVIAPRGSGWDEDVSLFCRLLGARHIDHRVYQGDSWPEAFNFLRKILQEIQDERAALFPKQAA